MKMRACRTSAEDPHEVVPDEGLEPSRLSATHFECVVSAIPPIRRDRETVRERTAQHYRTSGAGFTHARHACRAIAASYQVFASRMP